MDIRLASESDLAFASAILERAVREANNAHPGPAGKKTRRPSSEKKSEALRGFSHAKALKELEDLDPLEPGLGKGKK